MNKKLPVSIALTITIIAMTLTFSITMIVSMNIFDDTVSSVVKKQAMYDKLSEIDTYVRGNYFGEVDEALLGDRIGRGYVDGVGDKYSVYYSEKEYTEMQQMDAGKLSGVGIEVLRDPLAGTYNIARVYEDSPADKAGVLEGGILVKVGDVETATVPSVRAVQTLLRGTDGAVLNLTCVYPASEEATFQIQRTAYRAPTVEKITDENYTYIRISSFTAETAADFDFLVQQAVAEDTHGFVFDLRGNSGGVAGGVYESAYRMIDMLCPRGTIARSHNKSGITRLLATSGENAIDLPMVALVNENTAAAAELFAVSLRDLSGGKIVGVKTMGRGTLQSTPYRLSDGSAVSITIANLITGKEESYNEIGLLPDVEAVDTGEDPSALLRPKVGSDKQIARALETVRSMAREQGLEDGTQAPTSIAQETTGGEFAPQLAPSEPTSEAPIPVIVEDADTEDSSGDSAAASNVPVSSASSSAASSSSKAASSSSKAASSSSKGSSSASSLPSSSSSSSRARNAA